MMDRSMDYVAYGLRIRSSFALPFPAAPAPDEGSRAAADVTVGVGATPPRGRIRGEALLQRLLHGVAEWSMHWAAGAGCSNGPRRRCGANSPPTRTTRRRCCGWATCFGARGAWTPPSTPTAALRSCVQGTRRRPGCARCWATRTCRAPRKHRTPGRRPSCGCGASCPRTNTQRSWPGCWPAGSTSASRRGLAPATSQIRGPEQLAGRWLVRR